MRSLFRRKRTKQSFKSIFWLPVTVLFAVVALLFLLRVLPFGVQTENQAPPAPVLTPKAQTEQPKEQLPAPSPIPSTAEAENNDPNEGVLKPKLGKPPFPPNTRYELACELRPSHDRLYAKLRVLYENTTPDTLYELVFHLPPNANAGSQDTSSEEKTYPHGAGESGLIVSAVSLNGELAFYKVSDNGMQLSVPFITELLPGENAEVFIEFVLDTPKADARLGKSELGYQLGNSLPVLAVYQDGAFAADGFGYYPTGDPFYSETADYAVAIAYPEAFSLISTGSVISSRLENGILTSYIAAADVREFALMLTQRMYSASDAFKGIKLYAQCLSEKSAKRAAAYMKKGLEALTPILSEYPYGTLNLAQVEMRYAGMEYPGLLMVQRQLFLPGREAELELTIVHELIHQWFYGLVGNDQINAPWLDEALTSYLSLEYYSRIGETKIYNGLVKRYLEERASLGGRIDGSLLDYASEDEYVNSVYWRGAKLFHELRQKIGDDAFFNGLRSYIKNNAYKIAIKADLISAFEQESGMKLSSWVDDYLKQPAVGQPYDEAFMP